MRDYNIGSGLEVTSVQLVVFFPFLQMSQFVTYFSRAKFALI